MVHAMLQLVAYCELTVCWLGWLAAFVRPLRASAGQKAIANAPAARWGILLNLVGFGCIWAYVRPAGFEKSVWELVASMLLGPPSAVLAWRATRHLGKHWRYQAALNANHELVKTGPYAWIRHPVYASTLGMLLASGAAYTWWPMLAAGFLFYVFGTEIRVQFDELILKIHLEQPHSVPPVTSAVC